MIMTKKDFKKYRLQTLKIAQESLENSLHYTKKNDPSWALVEAQRAVKLLEVARGL